ncbi:MAG: small ribosomal subunit Rsm22 family protein, partial [bacterium]
LMALRDDLCARGGMHVVAPCLHQARCPMLAREGDWCHEARRIEPTPRVARIDRIVGRRDERALFAFLAPAPGQPPAHAPQSPTLVRLVTDTLGSRGKTERLACRADGELRLMRLLDRETTESNRAFLAAERGAVLAIDPLPPNDRISPTAAVREQPNA